MQKRTKKRVLVTGSSGFLGRNVVDFFQEQNYEVIPFDKTDGKDIMDDSALKKDLLKIDYVLHLAAVGDVYLAAKNPKLAATIGVAGTANLIHVANQLKNVKKIIYVSTWEVYGEPEYQPLDENHPCNPDHPYSISKYAGELMVKSKLNNIPWVILRLGSAYGPNMRSNAVIPLFINKAINGEEITIARKGNQIRQFTHAVDIAKALMLACEKPVKNEVFNIVSAQKQTIKQIAELVKSKIDVKIKYGPKRKGDVPPAEVSSAKARKILGWEPHVSFNEGFSDLFNTLGNPN